MTTPLLAAILTLTNLCGSVSVDTLGARVVSYIPAGGCEVFFMSETGTGGMPLCWPWFAGLGPTAESRRHGVARYCDFTVVANTCHSPSNSELTLRLESDAETRRSFPGDFALTVSIRLAERLYVSMTGENTGNSPFEVTEALHPYFVVRDSAKCVVDGLDAPEYSLEDSVSGRRIFFADEGGKDRRVWRPGPSSHLSKTVSSLAAGDWKRFVCVESGNMKPESAYVLRPGERHTLTRVIHLASVCDNAKSPVAEYVAALSAPVLETSERYASWDAFYERLFSLDANADDAWAKIATLFDFDERRADLRRKMVERIGGFPERTPLNAKVTGVLRRNGYRVEKVLFESRPGAFVTANLYLPDDSRFRPPYHAAVEVCGHSGSGKHSPNYQRLAVLSARNGMAAFVVDPLGQGERRQSPEEDANEGSPVINHLRVGVNAVLLGRNLAAFEIWDAMRALDYLDTRPDILHDGYGAMGNSGGGTQSVMLSALDDRVKATATSCFLCNLREQTMWRLLADSEQIIFGQLADGFNHAAYPLLGGNPLMMLARRDDMIPYSGTLATARMLQDVGRNIGRADWYSFASSPGPHGYNEQLMRQTVGFLVRRLRGDAAVFDEPEYDETKQDFGPDERDAWVVPEGRVQSIEGFKSVYSYLQDELDAALEARGDMTRPERARMVRGAADIDECRVGARTVVSESALADGTKVVRAFYETSEGYKMPVVELVPHGAERYQPLVLAIDGPRTNCAELVRANGKRAVFIPDLCACGEIGAARHHYACPHDDEETAKMLYLLGSSLVGRRAGELIALGKEAKRRFGKNPTVVTTGRLAVAAAHAIAAEPGLFTDHDFIDPPPSWENAIRKRAQSLYSTSVHGAMLKYDWVDLCEGN